MKRLWPILILLACSCRTVPPFVTPETDALIETTALAVDVIAAEAVTIETVIAEVEAAMAVTPAQVHAIKSAATTIKAAAAGLQVETLPALVESHEADNERATVIVNKLAAVKATVRPLWKLVWGAVGVAAVLALALVIVLKIK